MVPNSAPDGPKGPAHARAPGAAACEVLDGCDLVTIRNLRAWTLIGVFPHEREARQEIRIDAWLGTDTRRAAGCDGLEHAIDYGAVARAFREHAGTANHQLVETLAEDFAGMALSRFGAVAVRISIEKPGAVPGTDSVGVVITRSEAESAPSSDSKTSQHRAVTE